MPTILRLAESITRNMSLYETEVNSLLKNFSNHAPDVLSPTQSYTLGIFTVSTLDAQPDTLYSI